MDEIQIANRQREIGRQKVNIVEYYSAKVGRVEQHILIRDNQIFPLNDGEKLGNNFDEFGHLYIELINNEGEIIIEEVDLQFLFLGREVPRNEYEEYMLESILFPFPHYKCVRDHIASQIDRDEFVNKNKNIFVFYSNIFEFFVSILVCSGEWALSRIIENTDTIKRIQK